MAEPIQIKGFKGIQTGLTDPEIGSASVLKNLILNDVQGTLSLADGYEELFPLPGNDDDLGISNFEPKTVHTFFVPDHGGKTVTFLTANYTKSRMGVAGSHNTLGMWIRPYWNGSAWIDEWFELTETYVFRMASKAGSVFTLSNTTTSFQSVIDSNALANYVVVRDGDPSLTTQNFLKVTASTWGAGTPTITVLDTLTSYDDWVNDTSLLYVMRSFFNKSLPQIVQTQIRKQLDELRISTGREVTDLVAAVFFREKEFGFDTGSRDGFYSEPGCLDIPGIAWKIADVTKPASDDPLPEGTYQVATTLRLDDGQETELREVESDASAALVEGENSGVISAGAAAKFSVSRPFRLGEYLYLQTGDLSIAKARISDGAVEATYTGFGDFIQGFVEHQGSLYVLLCVVTTSSAAEGESRVVRVDPETMTEVATGPQIQGSPISSFRYDRDSGLVVFFTRTSLLGAEDDFIFAYDLNGMTILTQGIPGVYTTTVSDPRTQVSSSGDYVITDNDGDIWVWEVGGVAFSSATPAGFSGTMRSIFIEGSFFYLANTVGEIYRGDVGTWNSVALWKDAAENCNDFSFAEGRDVFVFSGDENIQVYDASAVTELTAGHASPKAVVLATDNGSDSGVKYVFMEDGSATPLLFVQAGGEFSGYQSLRFNLLVSPSLIPTRAESIRVWLKREGVDTEYVVCKEISLTDISFQDLVFDATNEHTYFGVEESDGFIEIAGEDYSSGNSDAITQLGRDPDDTGIITYDHSITAGPRAYAVGVEIGGKLQRNKVIASVINGEGIPFYDVFANDEDNIIDVEFNDGNYLKALAGVIDRVLCLKNKAVVLLTPQSDLAYTRDIVDYGVGIAAVKSLATYGEAAYWLDHSGVYRFSGQGLEYISLKIQDQLDEFTDTQREQAFGVIDSKYTMYRLYLGGKVFIFDFVLNEWITEIQYHEAVFASEDLQDDPEVREVQRFLQLSRSDESPGDAYFLHGPVAAARQDGQGFEAEFVTSKIDAPGGGGWSMVVYGVGLQFEAEVVGAVFIDFFGRTSEGVETTETVETELRGDIKKVFRVRPGFKCKTLRVGVRVNVEGDNEDFTLTRMTIYHDPVLDQETL